MFALQVISGPYKGQAFRLIHGEQVTVGRAGSAQVVFEDRRMSSIHAKLEWNDGGFAIYDLDSSNGTFVNGRKVSGRSALRLSDHVQLGDTIFQLRELDLETTDDVELIEPAAGGGMLALGGQQTEVVAALHPNIKVEGSPGTQPMILANRPAQTAIVQAIASASIDDATLSEVKELKEQVNRKAKGAKVVVQRDGRFDPFWTVPVTIGREHSSGIVIDDRAVSLRHAVFDFRDGRFLVRDVGSSNGIFVNKARVVEARLSDGDVVSVGSHTLLVVQGPSCLGVSLRPPTLSDPSEPSSEARLGVVARPLSETPKKKKKRASDLVWGATSDLDRGVFRARAALMALVLGLGLTLWMLAEGDSTVLAGSPLSEPHESDAFLTQAERLSRDRCTACHIGAGRIATLKCLDCHPYNRPTEEHTQADLPCNGCHFEHLGSTYRSAAAAALSCTECHARPHENLVRTRPKLVVGFDLNAPGDVGFHLRHQDEGVYCLSCHDRGTHSERRGIRGSCGACHAPELPAPEDCQMCHRAHPDRDVPPVYATVEVTKPPRIASGGFAVSVGLLVLAFLLAAMIPRQRKVVVELPEDRV